jgi:hypothetical protein
VFWETVRISSRPSSVRPTPVPLKSIVLRVTYSTEGERLLTWAMLRNMFKARLNQRASNFVLLWCSTPTYSSFLRSRYAHEPQPFLSI